MDRSDPVVCTTPVSFTATPRVANDVGILSPLSFPGPTAAGAALQSLAHALSGNTEGGSPAPASALSVTHHILDESLETALREHHRMRSADRRVYHEAAAVPRREFDGRRAGMIGRDDGGSLVRHP